MNSIALYIHIPFCEKKCHYCDFNSYSGKNHLVDDYIKALKKEMQQYGEIIKGHSVATVFFGGGTPSILTGEQMAEIMETLRRYYTLEEQAEISMEANPGTLNFHKLKAYYESGINRLSMGLQSCQNHLLKTLGRIHSFEEYVKNLEDARKAGFTNINTDLMFSLPGQTERDWQESLEKIVSLGIPHISAYSLIVEEGTPFFSWVENKKIILPDEEVDMNMYHYTIEYLKSKGYHHYEISNYAKNGFECKHNITYWHNEHYIGLGAGAHSYFDQKRFNNFADIDKYIHLLGEGSSPVEEEILVSKNDEIAETMFLGLRMMEGISIDGFFKRFHTTPLAIYEDTLEKLRKQGLIQWDEKGIWLTSKGIDLSNVVFEKMLLD